MGFRQYYGEHRVACDVLQELREMHKFRSYTRLELCTEELQDMFTRMESALWDQKELKTLRKDIKKARKKLRELDEQTK